MHQSTVLYKEEINPTSAPRDHPRPTQAPPAPRRMVRDACDSFIGVGAGPTPLSATVSRRVLPVGEARWQADLVSTAIRALERSVPSLLGPVPA